jgi:hypothetical protein
MTLAEYMDPTRFPLTTQAGFTPRKQFVIDAIDLDNLREYLDEGGALDDGLRARLAELEAKAAARPFLIDEAEAAG